MIYREGPHCGPFVGSEVLPGCLHALAEAGGDGVEDVVALG